MKTFPNIYMLRDFITRKPPLQELLMGVILPETKNVSHNTTSKTTRKLTAYTGIICDNKNIKGERGKVGTGKGR